MELLQPISILNIAHNCYGLNFVLEDTQKKYKSLTISRLIAT